MYDSPISLEEICLDVICDNILTYVEPQIQSKDSSTSSEASDCYDDERSDKRYKFQDQDIFLINKVSEKLMRKMNEKRILCDATLNIFSEQNTKLTKVSIKNSKVTKFGLQVLRQHKITDLELINMKNIAIGDIIECLNDWSIEHITNLNFSKCPDKDVYDYQFLMKMRKFKSIRSINFSFTKCNLPFLSGFCYGRNLEKIDISGTQILDLSCLTEVSKTLVSLSICDLCDSCVNLIPTLENLTQLKHLDVSLFNHKIDMRRTTFDPNELLERTDILPNLVSIDLSGWKEFVPKDSLLKFIESHPKLEFLGIVLTYVTFDPMFCDLNCIERIQDLTIAGLGNEKQIKVTLQHHKDRPNYVQKALYHLFQLTRSFQSAGRPDIFELVLPVMEAHSNKFGVQMAATACLYNLTRGDLSKSIHPKSLSKVVNLTLTAMESFPDEFQLQKNSLLTLCSDRILEEVSFDRFRCARLVLEALCGFEDVNMNRMAVAICSILASKLSTSETSELGSRPIYMRKLLAMVQSRVESRMSDITLKFTLTALWNLTDESAEPCKVFLDQDGAQMFLNVLRVFRDSSVIETKVLGLLNNIAEVIKLRASLLNDDLLGELYRLMRSENLDVSYFAAGIVAHLASDGDEAWKDVSKSRSDMLKELSEVVSHWQLPENEMVTYRSFKPFLPLLRVDMDYPVQLWAVWAIHHVCSKIPVKYCSMLYKERGNQLLTDLIQSPDVHQHIRSISRDILNTMGETPFKVFCE